MNQRTEVLISSSHADRKSLDRAACLRVPEMSDD